MPRGYGATQQRIIAFVRQYKLNPENNGFSPTYAEIAEALHCARSTVYNMVQRIVARNRPGKPWDIEIDDKGRIVVADVQVTIKPPL